MVSSVSLAVALGYQGELRAARDSAVESAEQEALERQRADELAAGEQRERKRADENARQIERILYAQQTNEIDESLARNDLVRAKRLLDECPEHLRNWVWEHLKRRLANRARTIGRRNGIRIVAVSPDGTRIAYGSTTLVVRDIGESKPVAVLDPQSIPVLTDAEFAGDGDRIVSGDVAGVVRVWDVNSGELLREIPSPLPPVEGTRTEMSALSCSPNGKHLAVAFYRNSAETRRGALVDPPSDPEVRVWDLESGTTALRIGNLDGLPSGVDFHPDGNSFV